MRVLKQLIPVMLVAFLAGQGVAAVAGDPLLTLVLGLVAAVLTVVVYAWAVRWAEKHPADDVALRRLPGGLSAGALIGLGWFTLVIVNIAFLEGYRVDGFGSLIGPVGLFGFMAAAAVTEEVMFRGLLFRLIERRGGTWIALVSTSVLFGGMHLINPDATVWGAIAIVIEAGGTFGAAYAATRNLWVPIGLHFGWNFAESAIFGTEVSGNGANEGLLHGVTSGPAILTGGHFGPEASPYTLVFGVIMTVVFLWLARRRGNLVPFGGRVPSAPPAPTATLAQ